MAGVRDVGRPLSRSYTCRSVFAHGFCVTSEVADVEYKSSDVYDPQGEAGLIWNDPGVGVDWPIKTPLLSPKDAAHGRLTPDRSDLL
jgi:dTDP-4-dehydrorhamnose 3,5-epimerase-like enzyme